MSLKGFHIIFIIFSILLSGWFAYWAFGYYQMERQSSYLITSVSSLIIVIALIFYEVKFISKTRQLK